jgi:hypothetical protein
MLQRLLQQFHAAKELVLERRLVLIRMGYCGKARRGCSDFGIGKRCLLIQMYDVCFAERAYTIPHPMQAATELEVKRAELELFEEQMALVEEGFRIYCGTVGNGPVVVVV